MIDDKKLQQFLGKMLRSFPDFAGKERFAFGEQRTSSVLACIV